MTLTKLPKKNAALKNNTCSRKKTRKLHKEIFRFRYAISGQQDLLYLKSLRDTLYFWKIPNTYVSIGTYSEEAVCLEYDGNNWTVYNGERGNKYNLKNFEQVEYACNEFLLRLSEDQSEFRNFVTVFRNKIDQNKKRRVKTTIR